MSLLKRSSLDGKTRRRSRRLINKVVEVHKLSDSENDTQLDRDSNKQNHEDQLESKTTPNSTKEDTFISLEPKYSSDLEDSNSELDEIDNSAGRATNEDNDSSELNDDSDEGPEDVSLAQSKLVAIETRKSEQDQVKRVRVDVKEKRRMKHELFRTQKVLKRSKVISKFPQEALEKVSMKLAEERASEKAKKKLTHKLKHQNEVASASLPSEAHVGPVRVVSLSESDGREFVGGALTNDFRQQHFYSDRLKRLPVLSIRARKYRNIPAKNFIRAH